MPRESHAIDHSTGELAEATVENLAAENSYLRDVIKGLERDIRGWTRRYAELQRDKQAEAEADPLWPVALRVFKAWREQCKHPRSGWTSDRFDLIRPHLSKHGEAMCLRAVAGAAYDPFITTRKNGSTYRHDEWELVFRDAGKFESFANRAPADWEPGE